MPWNRVYYPVGSLSQNDKDTIAKGITDIYAEFYPSSSTLVSFFPIDKGAFYKGGVQCNTHFRITLQHMAGSFSVSKLESDVRMRFRASWKPFVDDRGYTYELQIEEIPSAQVSFDNCIARSVLSEPLFEEMVRTDNLFPLKTVKG